MDNQRLGDYSITFEEALLESIRIESRKFEPQYQPDIEGIQTWVLRDSVRSKKVAKYWTIRDRHTGEIHHHQLTLETINRVKKHNSWTKVGKNTITLSDDDGNDIAKLLNALSTIPQLTEQGETIVINPHDRNNDRLHQILYQL